MSLYIVSSSGGPLPRNTYVYRYEEGFVAADMRRTKRGNLSYAGDLNQIIIPTQVLAPYVTLLSPTAGEYYWEGGEIHRRSFIWTPTI